MGRLQTPRSERALHQPSQTNLVKRNDGRQVVFPKLVVNHAKSGHYDTWRGAVVYLHYGDPKIHMLVVSTGNEFVRVEKENWPWADLVADAVAISLFHFHYFAGGWHLKASESCDLVAGDQHNGHPSGSLGENCEEDFNDAKVRAA